MKQLPFSWAVVSKLDSELAVQRKFIQINGNSSQATNLDLHALLIRVVLIRGALEEINVQKVVCRVSKGLYTEKK